MGDRVDPFLRPARGGHWPGYTDRPHRTDEDHCVQRWRWRRGPQIGFARPFTARLDRCGAIVLVIAGVLVCPCMTGSGAMTLMGFSAMMVGCTGMRDRSVHPTARVRRVSRHAPDGQEGSPRSEYKQRRQTQGTAPSEWCRDSCLPDHGICGPKRHAIAPHWDCLYCARLSHKRERRVNRFSRQMKAPPRGRRRAGVVEGGGFRNVLDAS